MTSQTVLRSTSARVARLLSTGRFTLLLLLAAATLQLSPAPLHAQLAGKGSIRGTVADATGAAIPDAAVVAANIATGVKQQTVSTGAGDFQFSLDPGKYTISVTRTGFKTFTQQNVSVDALQTFSVNPVLETGAVSESVTVTDTPPALETSNATLGVTMEQEMYASLPIIQDGGGQRRATDFATLLPGVSGNVSNGNLTTNSGIVNGGGSRGAASAIYINGVPITSVAGEGDPRFVWTSMAVDAINQFQVQTVGYSAIYEGQGVQNYIVKNGTNQIHGVLYDYFRNTALDTWGFTKVNNPITGLPAKPIERQNEYGLFAGFPIIKDKLFVFGGYEGYRFSRQVPNQQETIPTEAMRAGNFTGQFGTTTAALFDPSSTVCGNSACTSYIRTPFRGMLNGVPTLNVIPASRLSAVALKMQSFLPASTGDLANNYITNYSTGLNNWTTTNRIDYTINPKQSVSLVIAFGRQSTTAPAAVVVSSGSTTNGLPPPYISTQQFAPKTKVFLFEHTYAISPHVTNQFKYGYGRYDGPGYNQDQGGAFGAAALGFTGLPAGQASDSFPTVTFSGNTNINRWAGYSSNRPVASGYVAIDNVQWNLGKHSLTIGGELAWLQYNYLINDTGVNPLQLTFSNSLTGGYNAGTTTLNNATGQGYASFLIGAANGATFTQSAVPETGGRFRPISPYFQDNWKVTSRLTLDLGLRWDFYPTYREVKDRFSYFDPNKPNTLVGINGALAFGGTGANTCNCRTPSDDYKKNFGPRLGFAFQADPKTVFRGSYGIIYTHGNNNGGSAQSRQGSGLQGYSTSPNTTTTNPTAGQTGTGFYSVDTPYPTYQQPPVLDPNLGTYYTTASSQANQTVSYADPYYGGRAPQFINWSFGLQREITANTVLTMSYVGSQGHFLTPDSLTARGIASNQLDPKYLPLGSTLGNSATAASLAAIGAKLPFASFGGVGKPTIAQALKPFPQYSGVSDAFGFVGNTRYHALQMYLNQRLSHGLTYMVNYTWSRAIDNNGTFRSGYDIPAAAASDGQFHKARSLDRSLSLGDQRHKFVITGAYDLPFGAGALGGNHFVTRALLGGFKLSTIFQAYSGAPLAVVQNSCNTNPSLANTNACEPLLNPNYTGNGKKAGTLPFTAANLSKNQYLDPNAFSNTPNYIFSTTARTAALPGLFQPPNYKLDLSLRRSFPIPMGSLHEGTRLSIQADMFNVTNHTHFVYSALNAPLNSWSPTSTSYGLLSVDSNSATNRAVQLAARIEF